MQSTKKACNRKTSMLIFLSLAVYIVLVFRSRRRGF